MSLLPIMIWLNIPFSPRSESRVPRRLRASSRTRFTGGVSMTRQSSGKEKNLSAPGRQSSALAQRLQAEKRHGIADDDHDQHDLCRDAQGKRLLQYRRCMWAFTSAAIENRSLHLRPVHAIIDTGGRQRISDAIDSGRGAG